MTRQEAADAKYRIKFAELGIQGFAFIRFEKKNRLWFRCLRCGYEAPRGDDIFKGKQSKLVCRQCGNGTKLHSILADEVLNYYSEGHTLSETADKFGINRWQVQDWAKLRHVSNGKTFDQAARECNLKRSLGLLPMPNNEKQIEQAREKWSDRLLECGFELIEYTGKGKPITFRCLSCGEILERKAYTDLYKRGFSCPHCKEVEKQARDQEAKTQHELRRVEKENAKKLREEEKDKRLDAICICKVCDREYTPRQYMESCGLKLFSNPGYCSSFCKKKQASIKGQEHRKKSHTHSSKHYSRARKLGLSRERGITLKKLIERNGLTCAICGLPCFYEGDGKSDLYPSIDHIIPMNKGGGHTWDNVQIAHRLCNSNKRDYIGEEWHNGTT